MKVQWIVWETFFPMSLKYLLVKFAIETGHFVNMWLDSTLLCVHMLSVNFFYTWSGTTEMVNKKKKKAVSSLKLKIPLLLLKNMS